MSKLATIPQEIKSKAQDKLEEAFNKAIVAEADHALSEIERLRRVHPKMKPQQMISHIGKHYVGLVAAAGATAGAGAVVPNVAVQIPLAIADLGLQLERSVAYVLKVAAIKGLHTEDIERRRLLVISALVGDAVAKGFIAKYSPTMAAHLGKQIVKSIPREAIKAVNKVLGPRFITIGAGKFGALQLGKQVPFFVGAFLGAGGNALFALFVVKSAKKITGPTPKTWKHLS